MSVEPPRGPLRIATRGSRLARVQAEWVASRLGGEVELVIIETTGDRNLHTPLHEIGGTGVFVKEVQQAVLNGRADVAVHSAKDLPAEAVAGLEIAAVPERADARDVLVGTPLAEIPAGGVIATGAVRRRAQLAAVRPDLTFAELRGNIDTRLRKAAEYDAVVVALAALERLDRADAVAEVFAPEVMLPQVGQGALAVECRTDDDVTRAALQPIDHPATHDALRAERAYLGELGGGCELPCGAYAFVDAGEIVIDALLAALDGSRVARASARGADPVAVGRDVARRVLDHEGGRALLEEVAPR